MRIAIILVVLCISAEAFAKTIPNVGETTSVCLQTWMGTFVCAENGGGGIIVDNRAEAHEWETFKMIRLDADHVALKAHNDQFVSAENGGGSIVVANRPAIKEWETFALAIDASGRITLTAHNGMYLSAEDHGLITATRKDAKDWEAFRVVEPANANLETTRIEVNVYKIYTEPIWHTGTVVDGGEYYFQTSNRVETCEPGKKPGDKLHRTLVRIVPGNLDRVKKVRDEVIGRWNGTRYDLGNHNCDFFTDDLLKSLGTTGLDQEYLNASGLEKGLRQVPGGALAQEVLVKWPVKDKRLEPAFMEDLKRLRNLPADTAREVKKFFRL